MKLRKLVLIGLFALVFMLVMPVYASADSGGFTIEKYDVKMQVRKNNSYRVRETIEVYFTQSRHGIYRDVPLVNKVKREDGSSNTIIARMENISCGSDDYEVSRSGDNCSIKIGDEDKKISGKKTYTITYDYIMGNDVLKDADEFYYNVIGTGWQTSIENVTFSIQMPDKFEKKMVGMSYGSYGESETEGLRFGVDAKENMLYGELDPDIVLYPGEGVNVRLELPEGYFVKQEEKTTGAYIAFGLGCFAMILGFAFWWLFGRDDPVIKTVEFRPPNGMNSVEMMLAYRGYVYNHEVVSLLIHLAEGGYIQIQEGRASNPNKGFTIVKMAPYTGGNKLEEMFYNGLFKKQDAVNDKDLQDTFYKTIEKIIAKVNTKENRQKVFMKNSLNKGWMLWVLTIIMYVSCFYKPVSRFEYSGFLAIVIGVLSAVFVSLTYKALFCPKKILTKLLLFVPSAVFCGIMFKMVIYERFLCVPKIYLTACIFAIVATGVIMFFDSFLSKRTPYGTEMLGKIEGFKTFLETAEKEKLEALVFENPSYFYEILPYAYVLEVSDKWMDKFEKIAVEPPNWYQSQNNHMFNMVMFHQFMRSTMSTATYSMNSAPSNSSGGGGGFSGGGSGGGGGGSW